MITKQALLERIYTYLSGKIDILANDNPMIGFVRPLIVKGLKRKLAKFGSFMDDFAEDDGTFAMKCLRCSTSRVTKKYVGEKFDMNKAREVKEMYKSIIPDKYTLADVYVAINSQYHDYAVLFKSWFGNSSDHKIIESAVNFWFRDDDCPECKVWDYFKD